MVHAVGKQPPVERVAVNRDRSRCARRRPDEDEVPRVGPPVPNPRGDGVGIDLNRDAMTGEVRTGPDAVPARTLLNLAEARPKSGRRVRLRPCSWTRPIPASRRVAVMEITTESGGRSLSARNLHGCPRTHRSREREKENRDTYEREGLRDEHSTTPVRSPLLCPSAQECPPSMRRSNVSYRRCGRARRCRKRERGAA